MGGRVADSENPHTPDDGAPADSGAAADGGGDRGGDGAAGGGGDSGTHGGDASGGAPPPGRDPLWAKLLVAFGAVLVLLAGGAIGTERVIAIRYERAVGKGKLLAPQARATAGPQRRAVLSGPLNLLLLGSDARSGSPDAGERSDTIIVVHIPASMDRAYLVSIPRDLLVEIPAFPATGYAGGHEKINSAFERGGGGTGGIQLLSHTLTDLIGIQFDAAAIVDFGGFKKVVDLLGGVDMCVDIRTESIHVGFDKDGNFLSPRYGPEGAYRNPASTPKVYEPGCWHFTGWEALDYVRQRKTLPNGDYDRQRHQQEFLRAVADRVRDKGLATNPIALDRLITALGDAVTVDANGIPLDELAYSLRGITSSTLAGVTVPSEPRLIGGISYVIGLAPSEALYRALRDDTMAAWQAANTSWVRQM